MAHKPSGLPYEAGTPPNWPTDVNRFRFDSDTRTLSGDCPRCGHPFSDDLTDHIVIGLAPKKDSNTIDYPWECTCVVAHTGAPAGTTGCGANGVVRIRLP